MKRSVYIRENIGLGDGLQFSSLPENYHAFTGEKLVVESHNWFFEHNPYVSRTAVPGPDRICLWEKLIAKDFPTPVKNEYTYSCNAEIHAAWLGITQLKLKRPRLYHYEHVKLQDHVIFHPKGISQGLMPDHVAEHVLKKYGPRLIQIGTEGDPDYGIPFIKTVDFWSLAALISTSLLFIGMCSGPSWIAACYPRTKVKSIRTKYPKLLQKRIPLLARDPESHWDDTTIFEFYNTTTESISHTLPYTEL